MGTRALPDMYALSPWACSPRASGIHIRQSTRAHVITYTCSHFYVRIIHDKVPSIRKCTPWMHIATYTLHVLPDKP